MAWLNKVWNYLMQNRVLVICILCILVSIEVNRITYSKWQATKEVAHRLEINLQAANDTIRLVKTREGKTEYVKYGYLVNTVSELRHTNAALAKEIELTKGNVKTIEKVDMKIVHDTIYHVPTSVTKDGPIISLISNFDTLFSPGNYRKVSFEHLYNTGTGEGTGRLLGGEMGISAVTGIKKNKDNYEIFFRSNYPGLTITQLDGAIIDRNVLAKDFKQKQPLIFLTGAIGYTPITYDLREKTVDINLHRIGGTVGIGFNLNRK